MSSPQDLLDLIHTHQAHQPELELTISSHFGHATSASAGVVVFYRGTEDQFALRATYADDHFSSIEGGPGLKADDVDDLIAKIKTDVLEAAGTKVGAVVLFGHVPVTGYYRYQDLFQILPVPQDAPRIPYVMGDHPFLLEFRFPASANAFLNISRRALIGRELELFICGVVNGAIHTMGSSAKSHWVMTSEGVDPLTVGYKQEMYWAPGLRLERDDFSSIDGIDPLVQQPSTDFYSQRGISVGQVLTLPDILTRLYDTFAALTIDNRRRFLTSCFWFQHANLVHHLSRSAYFTALISAVEALMPPPSGESECPVCKKMMGPGPTARFAQFLHTYAPGAGERRRERKHLYGVRSTLSHGGALLRSDHRTWSAGLTPEGVKEWEDLGNAWNLIRVSVVNWLMSQTDHLD